MIMRTPIAIAATAVLTLGAFSVEPPSRRAVQQEPADLIFRNGRVYTGNDRSPQAEAVAVKGSKIVFVGSNSAANRFTGPATKVIDLKGGFLYPGFTDAHLHLSGVGAREMTLNLEGTNTLEDFLAKVKARVDQSRPGQWVTGRGWIETFWKPPVFPTRQDLDRIAPRLWGRHPIQPRQQVGGRENNRCAQHASRLSVGGHGREVVQEVISYWTREVTAR